MGKAISRAKWTPEQDAYLHEIYPDLPNDEVARLLDERFGTSRTRGSVKNRAIHLKVRKSPDFVKPQPRKFWTAEKEAWFREFVPGHHEAEISAEHERLYGTPLTPNQIGNAKVNFGVKSGTVGGQMRKGNIPWNKGKTWDELGIPEESRARCAATQFKPGEVHLAADRDHPVGYERVDSRDGYIHVKVRDSRVDGLQRQEPGNFNENWRPKHHVVYEQAHGPIPEGCNIVFADHDKRNFDPENLVAVPRALWGTIRKMGLPFSDRETLELCMKVAQLDQARYAAHCAPRECKACGATFKPRQPRQRRCDMCLGRTS